MSNWLAEAKKNGCGALPRSVELDLMAAARVGISDSSARRRAIDRVYSTSSRNYPGYFRG